MTKLDKANKGEKEKGARGGVKQNSKKKGKRAGSNPPVDDDDEATESDDLSKDPPKPKGGSKGGSKGGPKAKKKMYSKEDISYFTALDILKSGTYSDPGLVKIIMKAAGVSND